MFPGPKKSFWPTAAGAPAAGASAAGVLSPLQQAREVRMLGISQQLGFYILNKINKRLVLTLCNLETDTLAVCIEKLDTYFKSKVLHGKDFQINLSTIMGANEPLGGGSEAFLNEIFKKENGATMTASERQAYFQSEWPTTAISFATLLARLQQQKQQYNNAPKNVKGEYPTLRVGLHPPKGKEMSYIHIFGEKSGEEDFILLHCSYEKYKDATGIHFTDRVAKPVEHYYCNLLGYIIQKDGSKGDLVKQATIYKEEGEAYRASTEGGEYSSRVSYALRSPVPRDAFFAYKRCIQSGIEIPIPMCGTDRKEQSFIGGAAAGGVAAAAMAAAEAAVEASAAAAAAAGAPAKVLTEIEKIAQKGFEEFIPGAGAAAAAAGGPGYPAPYFYPPFASAPAGGPAYPVPPYFQAPAAGGPAYPSGGPMIAPQPPAIPRYAVINPYGQIVGYATYGAPIPPGHYFNTRTPYYGGKGKRKQSKTIRRKRSRKQTRRSKK